MSLALAHPRGPDLHWSNLGVALEQETGLGLSSRRPKRLLARSLIDFRELQEVGPCTRPSGSQHKRVNEH